VNSAGIPLPPGTAYRRIGFQDWEDNVLLTLLVQGNYMNDRLTPQIITAYDTRAGAGAIAPSVEYKPDNNWVFKLGLNLKWANHKGAVEADDNRSANPFPPATCAPAIALGPDPTPLPDCHTAAWACPASSRWDASARARSARPGTKTKSSSPSATSSDCEVPDNEKASNTWRRCGRPHGHRSAGGSV
jgi:hypothetical protein